jgi:hypothetical protein
LVLDSTTHIYQGIVVYDYEGLVVSADGKALNLTLHAAAPKRIVAATVRPYSNDDNAPGPGEDMEFSSTSVAASAPSAAECASGGLKLHTPGTFSIASGGSDYVGTLDLLICDPSMAGFGGS